jgi:hypothetical protein
MGEHGDVQRDDRRAPKRADDSAEAPAGMEAGHYRAPELLFDERALDVHSHLPCARPDAVRK